MAVTAPSAIGLQHPLEPLSTDEIAATVEILRRERGLGPRVRFVSISLHEPPKDAVLAFPEQGPIERQAFVILLDNEQAQTYEAVVSLSRGTVLAWERIPDVQPSIMLD